MLKVVREATTPVDVKIKKGGGEIGRNNMFAFSSQSVIDPGRLRHIKIGNGNVFSRVSMFCHDYSWTIIAEAKREILPDVGKKIEIGNNNFFGYDCTILGPVMVGDNNIIGAKSLVNQDIGSNEVWAGVPAKKILSLDDLYLRRKKGAKQSTYQHINKFKEEHGRLPYEHEFGWLSIYFVARTEENYNTYFSSYEFKKETNSETVKDIFFQTEPIWETYQAMISSYKDSQ